MGTRIVQMAIDFALRHNLPCVLVLDAFFPGAAVFKLAASVWSIELKQPLLTLIIRAKKKTSHKSISVGFFLNMLNNIVLYILEFSNFSGMKYAYKFKITIYQCDIRVIVG